MSDWLVPHADTKADAIVHVPGSKSLTNRYLLLAAMATAESTLINPLNSRDSKLMVAALSTLGAKIRVTAAGAEPEKWHITPGTLKKPAHIDCGLAGTVMRFVPALAAHAAFPVSFDGDEAARTRPMAPLITALRSLGVRIDDDGRGCLPFTLRGYQHGPSTIQKVAVDSSTSSQFLSALLLTGFAYPGGLQITHTGKTLPSLPHIDMTIATLRELGIAVHGTAPTWTVPAQSLPPFTAAIEPDLSNAAAFLAAVAVRGGTCHMPSWPQETTQAGAHILAILQKMGVHVEVSSSGLTITSPGRAHLRGIDANLSAASELTPVIAALAALATTPSHLTGIGHIRGHETDRLSALATELNRAGGRVLEEADGLKITPEKLHGCHWQTYADHRMAMAGAIVGTAIPGITIANVETTAKTFPDFARHWQRSFPLEPRT